MKLLKYFMKTIPEHNERFAKMTFAEVYPLYINKIERKGRNIQELDEVIEWLISIQTKLFIYPIRL